MLNAEHLSKSYATPRGPLPILSDVSLKLNRGDAAVKGRTIVLDTGGDVDRLAFDVHRDTEQILGVRRCASEARERAAGGNRQRRRTGDACAGRRLAACREDGVFEAVMLGEQCEQRQ